MTKRPRVLQGLLLVLVAAGAGTWWLASYHDVPLTTAAPAATAPAEAATVQSTSAVSPVRDLPPMPAHGLPLRDALPSLQSRADAGDSLAACRLGMELLRCAALGQYGPGHDEFQARQEAEQEARGNTETADQIAVGRAVHAQLRDTCAVVPKALQDRAHHYVRQAALAGEPEAMVRYAAGETITTGLLSLGYSTRPGFDQWRREARPVLMRAMNEGVPEAALLLAIAQGQNVGLLALLLPRDEVEASASLELTRRLFGDMSGVPQFAPGLAHAAAPPLDPESAADAQRMAEDWHTGAFQGRRLELADSTAALQPLHLMMGWVNPEALPGRTRAVPCDTAAEANP